MAQPQTDTKGPTVTLTLDDNAIAHLARGHAIRVNFDREESK